ncbi:hypothetical protein SAMN02745121_09213 [Nannocystis exedens]|uniref:Uncharacterized protein n=2 Tax=Nannocystis exedens TaxID=54 RepID=A0A1I2JCA1_9BACT|nr:hypothetical protein NAEX_05632 [Nannocystis exedens]SFF50311.1 hypothetical protein SAMN02745121_09213 [Nannocystis exedens]
MSACDVCEPGLPATVASSQYIEYHTWVYPDGLSDEAVVCMSDKLASMDRFVEFVAETLELDPPSTPIHYVWVPRALHSEDTWICPPNALGCFERDGPDGHGVVYSTELDLLHELVHAVEIPALGRSHPVFEEGMANYLSTAWSSAEVLPEFPAVFKAGVAPGRHPGGVLSMHFVGALLARGSMAQYVDFRSRLDYDDGLAQLAAAYKEVFGTSLDDFLEDASMAPVVGHGVDPLCADSPTIQWDGLGSLDTTLSWACGDGVTFGISGTFRTAFSLDVVQQGNSRMTISSAGGGDELFAMLDSCPVGDKGSSNVILASEGQSAPGVLWPGRHVLTVSLTPDPSLAGELHLKLR